MTDDNLSELADEPTIVETDEDGVGLNRWQKHGHDRLYLTGVKNDVYVDLQAGTVHGRRTELDVDGTRVTVTRRVGWDGNYSYPETVIDLAGGEGDDEEGEDRIEQLFDEDGSDSLAAEDAADESGEFDRIETVEKPPGVDTATVRKGDVLELVDGMPGCEGTRLMVANDDHMGGFGGDGGALDVLPVGDLKRSDRCWTDRIVDNGSGPLYEPVEEADVE